MKPRKSFAEHMRNQDETEPLQESLFSKGYAIAQNAQHNATKQKISTIRSNIHSLTSRIKTEDDINQKIDLLADITEQIAITLEKMSELSNNVKNIAVANTLFSEDIAKIIEKYLATSKRH